MNVSLLHNHFDQKHLDEVVEEMKKLGAPTIKVLNLGFDNLYQALEGSHRLRACEILDIAPDFEYVDGDDNCADLGLDIDDAENYTADEIGDWENYQITF